jgi:hypothetical protein
MWRISGVPKTGSIYVACLGARDRRPLIHPAHIPHGNRRTRPAVAGNSPQLQCRPRQPAVPVGRDIRRAGRSWLVVAIWIRLPQVSSNTAVVTAPIATGSWVNRTPSPAKSLELQVDVVDGERGEGDRIALRRRCLSALVVVLSMRTRSRGPFVTGAEAAPEREVPAGGGGGL